MLISSECFCGNSTKLIGHPFRPFFPPCFNFLLSTHCYLKYTYFKDISLVNFLFSLCECCDAPLRAQFSNFSLGEFMVYRNISDLGVLILYPATLPNLVINSRLLSNLVISAILLILVVCGGVLVSLMYRIISSAKSVNLICSLTIFIHFISFSCLITLACVSKMILNRYDDKGPKVFTVRNTASFFTKGIGRTELPLLRLKTEPRPTSFTSHSTSQNQPKA